MKNKKTVVPLQARGVLRFQAILDAASALLGEVGYDALTLTAVAARSGSAIPSLYRFFANKEELMDALADRISSRLAELEETTVDIYPTESISALVDQVIEHLAAVAVEYPGLSEIIGRIRARTKAVDVAVAARWEAMLVTTAPHLSAAERTAIVRMTMAIVRSGVQLIGQTPSNRRHVAISEAKHALTAYLNSRIAGSTNAEPFQL